MRAPTTSAVATSTAAVAVMSVSHLTVDVLGGGLTALLPSIAERLTLSESAVGLLVAVFSLAALASQPLMGGLADRFEPRRVTAVAAVVAALVLSAVTLASSVIVLVVVIVAGGLASAAFHPAGAMVARAADPGRPEMAVASFSAGGTAGLAVGPVLALALADASGRGPVPLLALPALVVAMVVWRLRASRPRLARVRPSHRPSARALLRGRVLALAATATLVAVATTTIAGTLPLWIAGAPGGDSTDPAIGWALATFSLAAAVGGVLGGVVAARRDPATVLPAALLLAAVPVLALVRSDPGSAGALVWLAVVGVLVGPVVPVLLVTVQDEAPERAAAASGMIMGLSHGLAGVVFLGVAVVVDLAGHETGLLLGAGAILPAAAMLRRQLRPTKRAEDPAFALACRCLSAAQVPVGC